MNLYTKQTDSQREQTCGCQGGGDVGEGWIRSLGLAKGNLHIGWIKTRSYCIAQGTVVTIL